MSRESTDKNNIFTKKNKIDFPIKENEEELLNQIWDSLDASIQHTQDIYNDEELEERYQDLKNRISSREKTFWLSLASIGVAAAVAVFLLLSIIPLTTTKDVAPIQAQLSDRDIKVSQEQVTLIMGDSTISNLGISLKIREMEKADIEMQLANGKTIQLKQAADLSIYVPPGKNFNLELSDGTSVTLNADTWFEYPSSFASQKERKVKINGEGFFKVKKNEEKPFYVEIPNGEFIRVLGTSFNISSYSDSYENITTVVSGKVAYYIPGDEKEIHLEKNEQIIVDKHTSIATRQDVDAQEFIKWMDGVIYFNDEPLRSIAQKLSRMYGVEINVSEEYSDSCFSGMISFERGFDYIIDLITTTSSIKCTIEDGIIYLK